MIQTQEILNFTCMNEFIYMAYIGCILFFFKLQWKTLFGIIITNYSIIMLILIYVNISISHLNSVERFDMLYVI